MRVRCPPDKLAKMFDTHCHVDDPVFDPDRSAVWGRAAAAGVTDVLLAGVRPSLFDRLWRTAAAAQALRVHVSLGVHPQVVPYLAAEERDLLPRLVGALSHREPLAIGECGLDKNIPDRDAQETWFRAQIRAARELRLPLILHVYGAQDQALRILSEERAAEVGGVAHSYSGSADLVRRYVDMNFAVSFAGPVTWAKARKPALAARAVPPDWLLCETDAPDQSPEGWRGQRNEPAKLPDVVAGLAAARGEDADEVAARTLANARRVFKLNPQTA